MGADREPVLLWGAPYYTYTRTRARALRVLHLGFYRKLYTGEDKLLTLSGMRVKDWGVKLYTNYTPTIQRLDVTIRNKPTFT